MTKKIKAYYIEDVDFMARVDFNGKVFFEYEYDENNPCIKAMTHKKLVTIEDGFDDGDLTVMEHYRNILQASSVAKDEIKRIYNKLSPIGKRRADGELKRIEEMVGEYLKSFKKSE